MNDGTINRLHRQLLDLAEHAHGELRARQTPTPDVLPERARDEYGERMKGPGRPVPDWVGQELNAFLAARLEFDRVASPEARWAALNLHSALTGLLVAPIDWEYREDQGAAQHDQDVKRTAKEFDEALERFRALANASG